MIRPNPLLEVMRFQEELNASPLDPRCISQAATRIVELVQEYENLPKNRAWGNVRAPARKVIRKTLSRLSLAARNTVDGSPSRTAARSLIRFTGCCKDFAELAQRASRYKGEHDKLVQSDEDTILQANARWINLGDDFELKEVKTTRELLSIGKALQNCLSPGAAYLAQLRRGEREFWSVRVNGRTIGLMSFDPLLKAIDEFSGFKNGRVCCSRETLLAILRGLEVSGDDILEFRDVGAYKFFAEDNEQTHTVVSVGTRTFKVWGRTGVVIICDDKSKWTKVTYEKKPSTGHIDRKQIDELDVAGKMDLQDILRMVLTSTNMRDVMNRFRPNHWVLYD